MKIIFSILAICFCVPLGCEMEKEAGSNPKDPLNAETKRKKSDVELNDYKGRVKIVKEFMFALEEISGAPAFTNVVEISRYDEKGREVEWLHEPDGEKFTNRFTFKYDENGLLVEFVRYGDSGEVEARGRPKYDKNGNKVEDVMYDVNGNIWSKFVYKYDKKGNKVECLDFQPGVGFAAQKFTYKYDSKGNMVEQIMYTNAMKEKVRQKHAYKYDGNGHKVGESTVNFTYASDSWADGKDSKTFHKSIYEYDEKGNIIKEINESVELHSIYKYDGNGKCLEIEQRNSAGKVIGKNIFKYDGKGNKVKETWHEPRTVNGETRFVPILGTSWEFTYWN